MSLARSLLAAGLVLSFSAQVEARVAQHRVDAATGDALEEKKSGYDILRRWPLNHIFGKRQDLDCSTPDLYIDILNDSESSQRDSVQTFCNKWLDIPPTTIVTDVTPTITQTTSANSTRTIVQTTRVVSTRTVVETATITPAAVRPRAANVAARIALANQIITSVLANGTDAPFAQGTGHAEAESGLSNACSCKNVEPTSSVTNTFTAPPVYTTVGKNRLRLLTITSTKDYTTTVTVTSSSGLKANMISSNGSSTEPSASSFPSGNGAGEPSGGLSGATSNSTTSNPAVTSAPSVILVSSGSLPPTAAPSGTALPVVIGIPFQCPGDDHASPHFIVDDLRYEYTVLCDTAVVTSNELETIPNVESETACAAECSLMNNAAKKDICQAATFTPVPGASTGSCLISGPTNDFVNQNGTTTVLLTGISSKANDCSDVDLASSPSNTTVNFADLASSVAAEGFSLSIPGLQSSAASGGISRTYYSSGFTDSSGWYHYSWYEVYASSSAWWAVYATSWSCTTNLPQTIVKQQPAENATSVVVDVTTIINGSMTTVISGTATFSRTSGSGESPPTSVPALTTGGSAAFTTGFLTSTSNATAGGSAQGPSPTAFPGPSGSPGGRFTILAGTGTEGSTAITLSGSAATANSTGSEGIVSPPTTSGQPESSGISTGNSSLLASSGTAVLTLSGATSTYNSTGGGGASGPSQTTERGPASTGLILPSANNGTFVGTLSAAAATFNSTGSGGSQGPSQTPAEATFATSSFTATTNSTGGGGSIGPQSSSAPPSLAANTTSPAGTFGAAQVTISGQTSTSNSTGGGGSQGPVTTITLNSTQIVSVTSGFSVASVSGAVNTANSTVGGSIIPSPTAGSLVGTISGAVSTANSTGGGTSIPPPTTSGPALASSQPSSSMNGSAPAGSGVFTTSGATSIFLSTGSSGLSPPLRTNISETASAIIPPTPSLNASLPSGTGAFSVASVTGVVSLSLNSTGTVGPTAPSSGALNITVSSETSVFLSTGSSGIVPPSANLTATLPASVSPSPSTNASTTGPDFGNSGAPRSGNFHRTTTLNSTVTGTAPGTAPVESNTSSPLTSNSTTTFATGESSSTRRGYGGGPSFSILGNVTSTIASGQPSITIPPVSSNSSAGLPPSNSTTGPGFGNNEGNRSGRFRASSAVPTAPANITLWPGTSVPETVSGPVPTAALNSTLPSTAVPTAPANYSALEIVPSLTPSPSANSSAPVGTGSASIPLASTNASVSISEGPRRGSISRSMLPTGSASEAVPLVSSNSSLPIGTASGSIPQPSANSTGPLSTGAVPSSRMSSNKTASVPSGVTAPSGGTIGLLSATLNSSSAMTTGVPAPSSSIPTTSGNTSLPIGTGSSSVPAASANITGGYMTEVPAPSSLIATPSGNTSLPVGTGTPVPSTAVAPITANSTGSLPTGTGGIVFPSGVPVPSNATLVPPHVASASGAPSPSVNGSAPAACPSATEYSTIARTSVVTTTYYETVPIVPSNCLPSGSATLSADGTAPSNTGTGAPIPPATTSSGTLTTASAVASPGSDRYRRSGDIATQAQIDAACADHDNLVFNSDYERAVGDSAVGWTTTSDDDFIKLQIYSSKNANGTTSNSARVLAAAPGRFVNMTQPVTLCPGKQYRLSSSNRQGNLLAKCSMQYWYGDNIVYTASPQETFSESEQVFTAGTTPQDVSKDLKIRATCAGEGGAPTGANQDGYMVAEFDNVGLTQV